jgi:tetratricopeptide (TPR) repeat protein
MSLAHEHRRHLLAAEGYVELGMPLEADAELERIDSDARHLPSVLVIRLQIYQSLANWELMQAVASKLAKNDPDEVQWAVSWAYATRRAESTDAARRILLHALERHPGAAILHFNLGCYECQLGDAEAAKRWLGDAFRIDPDFRHLAREDEDLRPLWDWVAGSLGEQSPA